MRKVLTYTEIEKIKNCSFYESIEYCPQITVTTDLRKGINWYPLTHNDEKLFPKDVVDFGEFFDEVYFDWGTPEEIFFQSVTISEFFRNKINQSKSDEEKKYYRGVKRNVSQLIRVINMLEECCAESSELRKVSGYNKDLIVLCDAWEYLIENNPSIYNFHQAIDRLKDKNNLDRILHKMFGDFDGKSIVLHGFYYISPIQERIFRLFEEAGYELIFLFAYHTNYPQAMETWRCAYSQEWGFDSIDKWEISGDNTYNVFGEIIEGRTPNLSNRNITITKYNNIIEFAREIKKAKQNGEVYSPNSTYANQLLKEIYPEEYGDRHLLSYPVGHFLTVLHLMWNEEKSTVILSEPLLREAFASGWLSINGVSSSNYVRDLDLISSYFVDCDDAIQWKSRISKLRKIYKEAVKPFYDNLSEFDDLRISEIAGNPFNKFGPFAVDLDRADNILSLIEKIIDISQHLFQNTRETNISTHMSQLEKLVSREVDFMSKEDDEAQVVQSLMSSISKLKRKKLECYVDDIVSAMHIYLSQNIDEEQAKSFVGLVYPILQIDAASIKHGKKVYVCMCDIDNMPGTIRDFEWPLNREVVNRYIELTNNSLLKLNNQNYELAAVYNRYYLFSAFRNISLELSWIDTNGRKKSVPSPYISLLTQNGCEISSCTKAKINGELINNTAEASPVITSETGLYYNKDHGIKDVKMEYALCPLRHLYSFILDSSPHFTNEFQNVRAMGNLIVVFQKLLKDLYDKETVCNMILDLFPQVREVEKQQVLDYLSVIKTHNHLADEYEGYEFTPYRFMISYPDNELLESTIEKYSELGSQLARTGINLFKPTDVKKACMYCPHEAYCRNCVHGIDQEDYYD